MSIDRDSEYIGEAAKTSANAAFTLFLGDFTYNLVLALGSIIIARMLGSEGYGLFSLALIPPQTLVLLTSLGIDIGVARYMQRYNIERLYGRVAKIVGISILLRIVIGITGWATCYIYAENLSGILINRPGIGYLVRVTAIVVLLQLMYNLVLNIFIGFNRFQATSLIKIVYSIFKTTTTIALLILGFGVIGALVGNIVGYAVSLLLASTLIYRGVREINQHRRADDGIDSLSMLSILLKYSLPLYIGSLAGIALSIYQNVLLSYTLNEAHIGGYRAVSNFLVLVNVVTVPISLALLPFFTQFNSDGEERLGKALNMANRYIAMVAIPITVISMVFSRELIYIFYGGGYLFMSVYLPLLFAPNLLAGFGSIAIPAMFNGIGVTRYNMYLNIVNLLIFIPVSYLLAYVLNYGLWGFLVSMILSSIATTALAIYLSRRFAKNSIEFRSVGRLYTAAFIAAIPILPVFHISVPRFITVVRVVVGGIAYLLIYVFAASLLRCITREDVDFIVSIFKRYPIVNVFLSVIARYANFIFKLLE